MSNKRNLKSRKRTTKTVTNKKDIRRVKHSRRKNSLSKEPDVSEDKGFFTSTEYEIESRKIHYGYFDRY